MEIDKEPRLPQGYQVCIKCYIYHSLFLQLCEHDDTGGVELPNHSPHLRHCGFQRSCEHVKQLQRVNTSRNAVFMECNISSYVISTVVITTEGSSYHTVLQLVLNYLTHYMLSPNKKNILKCVYRCGHDSFG